MDVKRARDKAYHLEYTLALLGRYGSNASYQQAMVADAYEAFNNNQSVESYNDQLSAYDVDMTKVTGNAGDKGEVPFIWIRLGQIRAKVGVLEGDLIKRGFRPQVRAVNADALHRKAEFRLKIKADTAFAPYGKELDAALGQGPMAEPDNVPETLAEVESFVAKNYKDQAAQVTQAILLYAIEFYRYRELRLRLFLDAVIAGRCHVGIEIRAGFPIFKYYNPLRVVTDTWGEEDHRDDDSCFMACDYKSPEDIAEEFGLGLAELQDLYDRYQTDKIDFHGVGAPGGNMIYKPFAENGTNIEMLVIRSQWIDRKMVSAKVTTDKHGNEHVQTIYSEDAGEHKLTKKEEGEGATIERRLVKTVRKAAVIGGDLVLDWGEATNTVRRIDNPAETMLDYCTLVPYSMNGKNVSLVQMISPIYALKEFFWTKIQLEISKSGGRGISIDATQLPPEWGDASSAIPIALYYLKGTGVHIRSGSSTDIAGDPPVVDFDMSVGNAIEAFLRLSEALDAEAGEMIGVTPTRQGEIVSANQLSGVTAQSNAAASLVTLGLHERFKQFESRVMTKYVEKAKICWAMNPERFRPALGDLNFDWIVKNVDVQLQDYGVFIYEEPIDKQKLEFFVTSAVSAGMPPHIGLKVMQMAEEDVQKAVDFFYKKEEDRQQQMMQQGQAVEQMRGENEKAKSQTDMAKAIEPVKLKVQGDLEKTDRVIAGSMAEKKLDLIAQAGAASQKQAGEIFKAGMSDLAAQRKAQEQTPSQGNS